MSLLDGAILIILILFTYKGYENGFIKSLYGFLGYVIAWFVAAMLTPALVNFAKHTAVYVSVHDLIDRSLNFSKVINMDRLNLSTNNLSVQEQVKFIEGLNFIEIIERNLLQNNTLEVYEQLNISDVESYLVEILSVFALGVIVFILLVVLIKFILYIIGIALLKPLLSIKVFKVIDDVLGSVLGFLKGGLMIYVGILVYGLYNVSANVGKVGNNPLIDDSELFKWFLSENLLYETVFKILF